MASAALEGYDHEREAVRAGTVTEPVLQGALRVAGALPGLSRPVAEAPRQALARLHVLAARDVVPRPSWGVRSPTRWSPPGSTGWPGWSPAGRRSPR